MFCNRDRCLLIGTAWALFFGFVNQRSAEAQLSDQTIVISEFFEEVFRLDPGGSAVDILNTDDPFGQLIEIIDPNTVIISSFSELYRFDVSSQQATLLTDLSFEPREITRDTTGNLIATGSPGVVSVDVTSGVAVDIFDQTFFSPSDVVVADNGLIYVTEFFDALGVVNPTTQTFSQIGNFDTNELRAIDIGPDGNLYVSSIDSEFFRVNPLSGATTRLGLAITLPGSEDPILPDEIKVDDDGNILYTGSSEGGESIFSFDPNSAITTTILNGDDVDDFFSVLDFDINSQLRATNTAVPEPSSVAILGVLVLAGFGRRRRFIV